MICASLWENIISTKWKEKISRKLKFGILNIHRMKMLLENFSEYLFNSLRTGMLKKIQIHYRIWTEFLFICCILMCWNCIKDNLMNIRFPYIQKHFLENIIKITIHNFLTVPDKKQIVYVTTYDWNCWIMHISNYFTQFV